MPALLALTVVTAFGLTVAAVTHPSSAYAAQAPVNLRTVAAYSVLGGETVTNTGATVLSDELGVAPGEAITGFPPGLSGPVHTNDAEAIQAKADLVTAYNDAAGRASTASAGTDLVGRTLVSGVYTATSALELNGTVTLDGEGDPNAVFIFQVPSTLITGSSSRVAFTGSAQACNVYWQVGSSATIGTGTRFAGTIMALTSISVNTGATVNGRALARNGQVSLQTNVFTQSACNRATPSPTPSASDTATASPSPSATTPTSSGAPTIPPIPSPSITAATPTRGPSSPSTGRPSTTRPTSTRPTSSTTTTRPAPTRQGEGVEGESASASSRASASASRASASRASASRASASRGTSSTSVRASDESTPAGRLSDTGSGPYDGPMAIGASLLVTVGAAFAIVGWRRRYIPRH